MADAIDEARRLYDESLDALSEQRAQVEEDLRFSDPSHPEQWDRDEKARRENDPGGARPCLVLDQLGQYIGNVAGQIEQRPPGLHAMPVDSGGDRKVAEQLDGWFRHIEHSSRAENHYARAATSAARVGVGYLTLRPEYTDRALGYQEPRIGSVGDPLSVVLDPWSVEIDGSDADFGAVLTAFSKREFVRRWPKAEPVSFDHGDYTIDDDRDSIVVADWWQTKEETTNCVIFLDASGDQVSLPEDEFWTAQGRGQVHQVLRTYKKKEKRVYWRRMSGSDVLDKMTGEDGKEVAYPADGIGIVPVYGYVGFAGGRMTYCGIARRGRSAQQAYNFHKSEERAYIVNAPKSPWLVPGAGVAPYKEIWDRASVEQRAYLPYETFDEEGRALPAPSRMPLSVNLQNHIQGSQEALRDIQAALGLYQASIGAPSNETSGRAIDARKQQGEASNAHFQTHLKAAVGRIGKLCVEMIPRLIDTRRQMRTLGIDGTSGAVTVDPAMGQAVQESPEGLTINPNIGRYDVRVTVGAAFSTQRQQAQEALTELIRTSPGLAPVIAPLMVQAMDIPFADKLSQVLTAMAPEPAKRILQPEQQGPTTEQLMAQVEQMKAALQEATQIAQQATQEAQEAKDEAQRNEEAAEAKVTELSIRAYEAETKRAQALGIGEERVTALIQQTLEQMLSNPDPMPEPMQPDPMAMQQFPAQLDQSIEGA